MMNSLKILLNSNTLAELRADVKAKAEEQAKECSKC